MPLSFRRNAWASVAVLAAWAPAHALELSGVVEDAGTPVPKAEVILMSAASRQVLENGFTDAGGVFRFAVKPGTFKVGAFKPGHDTVWSKPVAVQEQDVRVRVELTPKAFSDTAAPSSDPDCD